MAGESDKAEKRLLDPTERLSEILFGLIMVLSFTCSFSVATERGRADVRNMLVAALGCNLAWGIIDAVFYLMGCFSELGAQPAHVPGGAQGDRSRRRPAHHC